MKSLVDKLSMLGKKRRRRAAPAPSAVLPGLIPLEAQWDRVAGVVETAVEDVDTVRRLQATAEQQIDSAAYALQGLLAELGTVMPLPQAAHEAPSATVLSLPSQRAAEPARSGAIAA